MTRPQSQEQLVCLLNHFMVVAFATGIANPLALGPFLDDIVYEPLRMGTLDWPVAFELLLIYLRMVENNGANWSLSTVFESSGGIDAKRLEASTAARSLYPAVFFRTHGGKPFGDRKLGDDTATLGTKGDKTTVKGNVSDNATSNRGCVAWNLGRDHFKKHLDTNGRCLFRHACDQFVTDKGKGGQCLGAHKRGADCDYEADKKCAAPSKE